MTYAAYPARRALADRVWSRIARYLDAARVSGLSNLAPLPDVDAIEALIDAAFWTSLRREEAYVPKVSLAWLPPGETSQPLVFERRLPLVPATLARVAPAVERPGIHFGVWRDGDGFWVWGTTRVIPKYCLVLEVAAPGLLVIKQQRGGDQSKYANVAVLEGEQVKVIDENASSLPDCPSLVTSLLGFDSPASWGDSINVLVQLSVSMRAHARGGLLLVVPSGTDAWRESIVTPINYELSPAFAQLQDLLQQAPESRDQAGWQDDLTRTVEMVAGLTAVDRQVRARCVWCKDCPSPRFSSRRAGQRHRANRGWGSRSRSSNRAWWHPPPLGRAVRPRSTAGCRARGIPGRPLHDLRLVSLRRHGPRPSGGDAATLKAES
jgi:hypothetical protein